MSTTRWALWAWCLLLLWWAALIAGLIGAINAPDCQRYAVSFHYTARPCSQTGDDTAPRP